MAHLQRLGAMAAFVNVIVAIATLAVVVFLIGIPAIADPSRLMDLAIHNPTPLFMADGLKVISAGTSGVLILALANYLRRDDSALLSVATGFGMLSIVCLLGNAILSIYLIVQAEPDPDLFFHIEVGPAVVLPPNHAIANRLPHALTLFLELDIALWNRDLVVVNGPLVVGRIDVETFPDPKAHHLIRRHQLLGAHLLRGRAIAAPIIPPTAAVGMGAEVTSVSPSSSL
jgi:hypothetical protein